MCNFFSLVSTGNGIPMYFDWELRKKCLSGELNYNPDSHTSIADYFGHKGKKEDSLNKYEYNPLTGAFVVDAINAKKDDSKDIDAFCKSLDFSTIIPALIVKPVVHPFTIHNDISQKDKDNLKQWASVWDSVRASIWDSVRASVGASVRDSIRASVWDSVRDSVGDSVRASVWDSVWDSVGDSVWASVRDSVRASVRDSVWDSVRASVWASVGASVGASVWAYTSSFFSVDYEYDFSSLNTLWERGFVPSFDRKTWRLHSGKNAKIVYEWVKEKNK